MGASADAVGRETTPLAAALEPLPPAFRRALRRWLSERCSARAIDGAHRIEPELLTELAELGAFGVNLPEEYGGADLGLTGACATVDELARVDRSVATTVGLHLGLGTRGLVAYGSPEQRARWLPDLAAGTQLSAFATTEPGAGSDLSRLGTRTVPGGRGLRVDGRKIFVTNGGLASIVTITASTPGLGGAARGQSLIVLQRDDPGVSFGAEEHKLGLRGSSTVPLYIDDAEVSHDRVLGEPGTGARQLLHVLSFGRTIMSAGCLGTARAALAAAGRHTRERVQFGRPLAAMPVVRRQLANLAARVFAMEAMVLRTAALEADAEALERFSLSTKVFCSDADWEVCDGAVQLHGGSGYIEETGVALLLRDARITRIFEGANDVLLGRIGAAELVAPRPPREGSSSAAELSRLVSASCAALRERGSLAGLRDPVALHRVGRLAVARDAQAAAEAHADTLRSERAFALAHLHGELARADADHTLAEQAWSATDDTIDAAISEVHQ